MPKIKYPKPIEPQIREAKRKFALNKGAKSCEVSRMDADHSPRRSCVEGAKAFPKPPHRPRPIECPIEAPPPRKPPPLGAENERPEKPPAGRAPILKLEGAETDRPMKAPPLGVANDLVGKLLGERAAKL